jgi:hypothetical protein
MLFFLPERMPVLHLQHWISGTSHHCPEDAIWTVTSGKSRCRRAKYSGPGLKKCANTSAELLGMSECIYTCCTWIRNRSMTGLQRKSQLGWKPLWVKLASGRCHPSAPIWMNPPVPPDQLLNRDLRLVQVLQPIYSSFRAKQVLRSSMRVSRTSHGSGPNRR